MYTPSFVKIPDGGLKIAKKLVELTWNDSWNFVKGPLEGSNFVW